MIEQQTVIYMSKLKIQHNFLDTNVFDTFFKSIKDESFPWFRGYKVEDDKKQIQLKQLSQMKTLAKHQPKTQKLVRMIHK